MMRIHVIQHLEFETGGAILEWAAERGHEVIIVRPDMGELLPHPGETDLLVVLGGAFAIEDLSCEWLNQEKTCLLDRIARDAPVLAICGGAQLLSHLLGGKVTLADDAEIGWHDVEFESASFSVFHWHRAAFSLPPGATLLAASEATAVQAFRFQKNILGVQFHPEITAQLAEDFISELGSSVAPGRFVQSLESIREGMEKGVRSSRILLLKFLESIMDPQANER